MKNIKLLLFVIVAGTAGLLSNPAFATKWVVTVQNFNFSPSSLPNVTVGDTIRWEWVNGSHTTTSTTIPAGAASWDHPLNSSNTVFEYHVTVAGTYNYKCTPHEGMGMVASFVASGGTPLLLSIVPNSALQGASFLATITGSNTNFSGSPTVQLSFSNNPLEVISATSVTVISPTVIHANFTIPASASPGLWDVHVNSLVLDNGFTVIEAVPAILSISPGAANQGTSFTGTVTGQYTGWSGTPAVSLSFSGNPGEIITGTNVVVLNSTHLTADFAVPSDASPGFWTVHVDALQLVNGFTVNEVVPAITFMDPNFAHQGDALTSTVFGQNTSWSGTPSVSLSFSGNPSEIITGTNVVVVSNTELMADFAIPSGASTGNYTVHVDALQQANAFTVLAAMMPALSDIVPDNGLQNTIVPVTITAENTAFEGTNPSVSLSLAGNPAEIIQGTNVVVVNNTTLTADFDIPYNATPGLWNLHVDMLMLMNAFTVIEVIPALVSIVPDSAFQGEQVVPLITAVNSAFTQSDPVVFLSYTGNPSELIIASAVSVLSDTQIEATFDVPSDASVGSWDLHVNGMIMEGGFTVNLFTGINDPSANFVRTYPNPAKNQFFVENASGADVFVLNSTGQYLVEQQITSDRQAVDISGLTPGIYIVKIRIYGTDRTKKLIVN